MWLVELGAFAAFSPKKGNKKVCNNGGIPFVTSVCMCWEEFAGVTGVEMPFPIIIRPPR